MKLDKILKLLHSITGKSSTSIGASSIIKREITLLSRELQETKELLEEYTSGSIYEAPPIKHKVIATCKVKFNPKDIKPHEPKIDLGEE